MFDNSESDSFSQQLSVFIATCLIQSYQALNLSTFICDICQMSATKPS